MIRNPNSTKDFVFPKKIYPWIISSITLAGAFLRFKGLAFQSFWLDEVMGVNLAVNQNLKGIVEICRDIEVHPPLYYILIWIWGKLFGVHEYSLRFLSAFIGVLGILAVYRLGQELFSKETGLYAAAIVSFNVFHIYYSQEARGYSLIFLLTVLSYLFFVKQTKNPSLKNNVLYILSTAALLYTHYFGYFILASQVVFMIFAFFSRREKTKALKTVAFSLGSILILVLPWIRPLVRVQGKIDIFWKKPGQDFFIEYFKIFFGREPYLLMIFCMFLIVYAISKEKEAVRFEQHKLLLFTWLFVTLLIPYLWSFDHPSPLQPRYTIIILPALVLIGGKALEAIQEKPARIFIFFTIILMSCINLFFSRGNYYRVIKKQQWRETSGLLISNDFAQNSRIYGSTLFEAYIKGILKHEAKVQSLPKDVTAAREIIQKAKTENCQKIWMIEINGADEVPEPVKALLDKNYDTAVSVDFIGVRARIYTSLPQASPIRSKLGFRIPLRGQKMNGDFIKASDGIYEVLGSTRLCTSEISFSPGDYVFGVKAKAAGEQPNSFWLKIYAHDKNQYQKICLDRELKGYEITFKIKTPSRLKVYLELDDGHIPAGETVTSRKMRLESVILKKLK